MKEAEYWKKRDTSHIEDLHVKVAESEWNFSTAYKGTVSFLSHAQPHLHQQYGLTFADTVVD